MSDNNKIELSGDSLIKYNLITNGLEELIGDNRLRAELAAGKTHTLYWGTAPTGIPSIGYFCPLKKIADFLKAGVKVTILFADLHAFLDDMKSPLELLAHRTKVYELVIKGALEALGVDHSNITFVVGSSFQLTPSYTMDLLKLGNYTTIRNAQKAGTEVVKQSNNPLVTHMLYPLMQALDIAHLKADLNFGGNDQRKIFMYADEYLPKMGYTKPIHLMNTMIPALSSAPSNGQVVKMSSSDTSGKISLLDTPVEIKKKVSKAYCKEKDITDNSCLNLTKQLIFPILDQINKTFFINRPEKYGGNIEYKKYEDIETDYASGKLTAPDLKIGVTDFFVMMTQPIRNKFQTPEAKKLLEAAYSS